MKPAVWLLERFAEAVVKARKPVTLYTGQDMQPNTVYRVPLPQSRCSDGSQNCVLLRPGDPDKLVVFFIGGGLCWNAETVARPSTLETIASGATGYYIPDMGLASTFALSFQFGKGLFAKRVDNPLRDWSVAMITYATGDLHVGSARLAYADADGTERIAHLDGQRNFNESLAMIRRFFPAPRRLFITGISAGGFGAAAHAPAILDAYPACTDATLLTDAALLVWDGWRQVASEVWRCGDALCSAISTNDLAADWLRRTCAQHGDSLQLLLACSCCDYVLTTFSGYLNKGLDYKITQADCRAFTAQLAAHIESVKRVDPHCGVFIHDFREKGVRTGTQHGMLGFDNLYRAQSDGVSCAGWLADALNGCVRDVGLALLKQ